MKKNQLLLRLIADSKYLFISKRRVRVSGADKLKHMRFCQQDHRCHHTCNLAFNV